MATNVMRSYVVSESANIASGSGPYNLSSAHDGSLSSSAYVYDQSSKGDSIFGEVKTAAVVVYYWEWWFNAAEDDSFGIYLEDITAYLRFRSNAQGLSIPTDIRHSASIDVYDQDLQAWQGTNGAWSSTSFNWDRYLTLQATGINRNVSGIRLHTIQEAEAVVYKGDRVECWTYLREINANTPGSPSRMKINNDSVNIPLVEDGTGASALRYGYEDSDVQKVGHLLLVDSDHISASSLRVQTPSGTKSVALFGNYE